MRIRRRSRQTFSWCIPSKRCLNLTPLRSEEVAQKFRRLIGNADDFVRRLTIELEVELCFRSPIIPVGKGLELAAAKVTLCGRNTSNRNADARRLSGDTAFLR